MTGWLALLAVDVLFALAALHALLRRVLPALDRLEHPALITDVWAPIALVLPALFLAGRVDDSVLALGWVPVASTVCAAAVGAGLIFLRADSTSAPARPRPRTWLIWTVVGLLLLMLGAAHELTIWTGQCFFAVAAVVLWLNTPLPPRQQRHEQVIAAGRAAGWAMAGVFVFALAHGILAMALASWSPTVSAVLVVGYAMSGCVGAAVVAGGGWGLRIVGWSAALGVLLGAGVLSLIHLLPQAVAVLLRVDVAMVPRVAHGFGLYAFEAILLIVLAAVGWMLPQAPRSARVVAGVLISLAALVITVSRLVSV